MRHCISLALAALLEKTKITGLKRHGDHNKDFKYYIYTLT